MSRQAYEYNQYFLKGSLQRNLIALQSMEYHIECFSPYYNKAQLETGVQQINKGDIIKLTNHRKFLGGVGWYILIMINNQDQVYVSLDYLFEHIENGQLCTIIDFELKINFLQHLLDKSLEKRDKEMFFAASKKLNAYHDIINVSNFF